jgi:hypothetical protein
MGIYKGCVVRKFASSGESYTLWQSNVLISGDGRACLSDFGSARVEEVETQIIHFSVHS